MGLTTESFNADGSTKVFSIGAEILSESHIRVHFTYDGIDHAIPSSEWDVLSSAVIFDEAPSNGYVVKITISTDGQGLDDAPTDISSISENITTIVNIKNNLPALNSLNSSLTNLNKIAIDVLPNIDEILLAGENANSASISASTATDKANIATEKANIATTKAIEAVISASNAEASSLIVSAYGNIDFGGFTINNGELIVDYFNSAQSVPSLVDGELILTY